MKDYNLTVTATTTVCGIEADSIEEARKHLLNMIADGQIQIKYMTLSIEEEE